MKNIGLLLVSTWKYNKFIDPLIIQIKKYFLKNSNVKIYLHTDSMETHDVDHQSYLQHKPWPRITLERFDIFNQHENLYNADYLFYLDIDSKIIDYITEDILSDFVVVQHHWFIGYNGTRETNPKSLAYIDPSISSTYICGGFFGGSKERFMNVSKKLANNISEDLNQNIIAKWHDESHLNHYFANHSDTIKVLSPEYMYWTINTKHKFQNPKIIPYTDEEKGFDKRQIAS